MGTCHLGSDCLPTSSGYVPCEVPPHMVHQAASALTFSKTPVVAGQLAGSWHTHMGELLSSTSHTLPCLQWWFWQGSRRGQEAQSEPTPSSPPTSCLEPLSIEGRQRFLQDSPKRVSLHWEDVRVFKHTPRLASLCCSSSQTSPSLFGWLKIPHSGKE